MSAPPFDVFVIGAGVAGLAAAEFAARRGLSACLAEETLFGGLVINVNHLQPGLPDLPGGGADLAAELMTRVSDLGVTLLFEPVTGIEAAPGGGLRVATAGGVHAARCVVLASGARQRALGVPGEAEFEHRGVSHCADCDAPMFSGETVVVVGGGDSALQEALVLAGFCTRVHLVHRGSGFSGRDDLVQQVRATPNLQLHLDTVVEAIVGDSAVSAVRVRVPGAGAAQDLPCKGVFAYVGLEPNIAWLPPAVLAGARGVHVDDKLETSLPGVFAIGAVRAGHGGQLTDAVRDAQAVVDTIGARLARA